MMGGGWDGMRDGAPREQTANAAMPVTLGSYVTT